MDVVFTQLKDLFKSLYENLGTIVGPIAILAVAICAVKIIMADNAREVQTAKSWLIGIVIGILLFYLAPTLVEAFQAALG